MAYIGRTPTGSILTSADIADGSISTAKLEDTAVSTAKIANDAVGNTKLDLDADYAFTGTVTGAGDTNNPAFIKRTLNTSAVSNVDVTSCFSATYDVYIIYGYIDVITDANQIYFNFLKNTSDNFSGSNMNGNTVGYVGTTSPSSFTNHGQASATYGRIAGGNVYHAGNGSGCLFQMKIANPFDRSDGNIHVGFTAMYEGSSGVTQSHGAFVYSGTEVASGIRFGSFGSAQLAKCSIDVYGVLRS